MKKFSSDEKYIKNLFTKYETVKFKGKEFIIQDIGKPSCSSGEPKTDIYILLKNNCCCEEIKISYKKANADFLENKISNIRAEQIFGNNWREIIRQSTKQIQDKFLSRPLIFKNKLNKTEQGSITLGWKFELLNKESGELSGKIYLTNEQILDIYFGRNLDDNKKNAYVNEKQIQNSGVANCLLTGDEFDSAEAVLNNLIFIDEFINQPHNIYFACKALNYRTYPHKYDGNRPLAVQVDWTIKNGKLSSKIMFDNPLEYNGTEVFNQLINCLAQLNIKTVDDIDESNSETHFIY